jgi:hypothetical protein
MAGDHDLAIRLYQHGMAIIVHTAHICQQTAPSAKRDIQITISGKNRRAEHHHLDGRQKQQNAGLKGTASYKQNRRNSPGQNVNRSISHRPSPLKYTYTIERPSDGQNHDPQVAKKGTSGILSDHKQQFKDFF